MRPAVAFVCLVGFATAAVRADEPPAPATPPPDPVLELAQGLKEASALLEKAAAARGRGNRSFAEQLFSSAEILVGPEALASLAPLFRKGAPPRVTAPVHAVDPKDATPQPATVGSSDEDEPEPKPLRGSIAGTLTAPGGKPFEGLAVVTLEPASGKWRRRSPRRRVMEQRKRQFAPQLMVVPIGSTVSFPNWDPVYHNVFSTSEARPFDLGIYREGMAREIAFEREGVVTLGCNLHANMSAHIVVVNAPHYAIIDDKGRFNFRSVEPGNYRLRAWSERSLAPAVREITVKPERNPIGIELKADAPKLALPDKFGVPRGG